MGLLDGKRIVVTGVLTDASLAFGVAAARPGGGRRDRAHRRRRGLSLTERTARKLPIAGRRARARRHRARAPRVACATRSPSKWDRVDGVLHAIGFAPAGVPRRRLPGRRRGTTSPSRCTSRAYSLKALADAFVPLMTDGGSFVGLDFDNDGRLAGLQLDGRGQGRARVDQPLPRPRARAAQASASTWWPPGPVQDDGGQVDPRLRAVRGRVGRPRSARLGRHRLDAPSPRPASRCCRDWFPATTGEIIHVDGGYHAIGA